MFAQDYRPQKFSEVVGQDLVVQTLKALAMADGVKVRSVVLKGSFGCGKTTCARIFAKAMNCKEFRKTGDVCDECAECLDVKRPASLLYREYDASRVGNVDAIRGLTDALQIRNFEGRRVVVFDECHAISKSGLTALLKILEEGVTDTIFVFCTTEPLLKTIESRSVCLEINKIAPEAMIPRIEKVASLEGVPVTAEQLEAIAFKSQGHMRNALSILEHFSIAGSRALDTPITDIDLYFKCCFAKREVDEVVMRIMQYPLLEVQECLRNFIKKCFVAKSGFPAKVREKGLVFKVFQYFYTPEAQQAFKDETGMYILLKAFAELLNPTR